MSEKKISQGHHFDSKKNKKGKKSLTNNINRYNDYELNNLGYNIALKNDKRSYFQYYYSLLKMKHLLYSLLLNQVQL